MKKITAIQDALDQIVSQQTSKQQLLPLALLKEAKRQNLCLSDGEIERLSTAILEAKGDTILIDLVPPCGFGATEIEINAALQKLVGNLSGALADTIQDISDAFCKKRLRYLTTT